MKVLVTGGTGFVGSHSVRALLARGHQVTLLARSPDTVDRVFAKEPALKDRLRVVKGDMTNANDVRAAIAGVEGVLHCAAMVALERKHAQAVMQTNERGVRTVLGSAIDQGCKRIVHVSSVAAIFDPRGRISHADSPLVEGSSAYSRSKASGDQFARDLQAQGAPVHISYPVAVVGPDDPGLSEANNALVYMLKLTSVVSSGAFQMVDVRDLADGHAALFDRGIESGRHLFGGHCMSWQALTDLLSDVVGRRVRRVRLPGWSLRLGGHMADQLRRVVPIPIPATAEGMMYMTRWVEAQSSPSVQELGLRFRPAAESLRDALRSLHEAGHLSERHIGCIAAEPARA